MIAPVVRQNPDNGIGAGALADTDESAEPSDDKFARLCGVREDRGNDDDDDEIPKVDEEDDTGSSGSNAECGTEEPESFADTSAV
jgi:hypothetical protein